MKSRCLVGATRTTRRRSSPSAARVRQRIVSLEKPFDAGACTSKTSGPLPPGDLVASQRVRIAATSSGSRWSMSGTGRHFTDGGDPVGPPALSSRRRPRNSPKRDPVTLLDYQLSDGIATIRLDDGKVNVMSLDMQAAIGEAVDRADADDAAIVLTGRPGVFSAGFDLAIIGAGGPETAAMVIGGFRLAERILAYPRPVVVGCTGHAIAMGTFLMFAGDYRIGPDAGSFKWIANEVAIGLTMPRAAIEMLRLRLTPAACDRAVILSYQFGPADALASGYFDQLVPARRGLGRQPCPWHGLRSRSTPGRMPRANCGPAPWRSPHWPARSGRTKRTSPAGSPRAERPVASVAAMIIVIDLSESRVLLQDPDGLQPLLGGARGRRRPGRVVRQSGLGRLKDDGEHVVVDPVALRALAGPGRDRGVGRGLRRHVRVRRRQGLDGAGRRDRRPHRAPRRDRLSRRLRLSRLRRGAATLGAPRGESGGGGVGPLTLGGTHGDSGLRPLVHRRRLGGPGRDRHHRRDLAGDRRGHRPRARRHRGRHRQGGRRGADRLRPRAVAPHGAGRAGRDPAQGGRADHGRDGRHGRDHHAGDGRADHLLEPGPGAGADDDLQLLRRPGGDLRLRRGARRAAEPEGAGDQGAGGRGRGHRPVERAALHRRGQAGAVAGRRLHRRLQAGARDAARRVPSGRDLRSVRVAQGRALGGPGGPRGVRAPGDAPGRRQDLASPARVSAASASAGCAASASSAARSSSAASRPPSSSTTPTWRRRSRRCCPTRS